MFDDLAPFRVLIAVTILSLLLVGQIIYASVKAPFHDSNVVLIEPCALVATQEGTYCR